MPDITTKITGKYAWLSACGITAVFFLLFFVLCTPLLNSGDDAYLMYTLGGGYGEKPSSLLQYNQLWHPILAYTVKTLFSSMPGTNWYTIMLLFFHFAGCSAVLYVLLKRLHWITAIAGYFLLFFFTEARLLLSFGFTGAAFTAAFGGMALVIHTLEQPRKMLPGIITGSLLVVLAGLLRLQVAWLGILLMGAVAIVLLKKRVVVIWLFISLLSVFMLWVLNLQHKNYYKKNIPGWEQQEKFRQALFLSYNRQLVKNIPPGVFKDSTEQAFFFSAFFYDTSVLNTDRIQSISRQITRNRSIFNKEDRTGLYWFFVEMRVYLLLIAALVLLLVAAKEYRPLRRWLLSWLAFFAVHSYLFVFLKITMPIHLGLLFFLLLSLLFCLPRGITVQPRKKWLAMISILLLLSSTAWMAIRLSKENQLNTMNHQRFQCALQELNANREKLLVATDDTIPLDYFYIWDTPVQYPVSNLLYKDRLITFTYKKTLERYHIKDIRESLRLDPKVFFTGKRSPLLERWAGDTLTVYGPLPGHQCLQLWQYKKGE